MLKANGSFRGVEARFLTPHSCRRRLSGIRAFKPSALLLAGSFRVQEKGFR
jgi:hypothetical protein